jgi:hypothetical protein
MAAMPPAAGRTCQATPTTRARPQQSRCPRRWGRLLVLGMILVLVAALVPRALADTDDGGDLSLQPQSETEQLPPAQPPADVALNADSNGGGGDDSAATVDAATQLLSQSGEEAQTPADAAQSQPESTREQVAEQVAAGQDPPDLPRQDLQLGGGPGCVGDGCSKAPPMIGGPAIAAIGGGSEGGAPPGGGSEGEPQSPRAQRAQVWDVIGQIATVDAKVQEVIEWRREAQREEYDAALQAALEEAMAAEMGPIDRASLAAELARISENLQRLEPRVTAGTAAAGDLEYAKRKLQEVSERLQILPMSSVDLDLLNFPEQHIPHGKPVVPDLAGYGPKETTIPDLAGFAGNTPMVAGPAPYAGTPGEVSVGPIPPTPASPGWRAWLTATLFVGGGATLATAAVILGPKVLAFLGGTAACGGNPACGLVAAAIAP